MKKQTEAVVKWMMQYDVISREEKGLYIYALHSGILLILPLILAGSIGFCLGDIKVGIALVLPYMILRKFSGGYHTKTIFHCMIGSLSLLFLCIRLAMQIKYNWKLMLFTGISSIGLLIFSPIDNENRVLDNEEKHRFKKLIAFWICILHILCIILIWSRKYKIVISLSIGIQMAAILQIPCVLKKWIMTKSN